MADANPAPTPDPVQVVDPPPELCIFCFSDWCQDQAARVQMGPIDYSRYKQITGDFSNDVTSYYQFRQQMKLLLKLPDTQNRHLEPYWEIFHRVYIQRIPVEDDPLLFYPIDLCIRLNIITGFDFFTDPEQANRICELNSKESDIINAQIRLDLERHRSSKAKGKAPELEQAPLEGAADNNVETQKDTPERNCVVKLIQAVDPPPELCIYCLRDWCQDQAARVQMSPTDYSKYMLIMANFVNVVNPYELFQEQMRNLLQHPDTQNRHLLPYWEIFHIGYLQRMSVEYDPLFFYPIDLCIQLNIITGFEFFANPEEANRIRDRNSKESDSINAQIRLDLERHRSSKAKGKAPELEQAPLEGAADNNVETQRNTPKRNYVVNPGIKLSRAVDPPPELCIFCFRDWCQDQAARVQMSPTDYSRYKQITGDFSNDVTPYKSFRAQMKKFLDHPNKGYSHLLPYWEIFQSGYILRLPVEHAPLFFYPIDLCIRLNIITGFDFSANPKQANRIRDRNSKKVDSINAQIRQVFQRKRVSKLSSRKNPQYNDPYRNRKAPELEQAPLEGAADNRVETSNYVGNLGINSIRLHPTAGHQTFMPDVNPVPTPDPVQTVGPPPDGSPELCVSCFRDWCQDQAARFQMSAADYSKYMQITEIFSNDVTPYDEFRQQMRNLLQHPGTQNKHLQPYWDVFHRGYIHKMPVEDDPLYNFPIDLCRRLNIIPAFDFFADPKQANWIPEHDSKRADIINHQIQFASEMEHHFKFPKRDPYLKRKAPEPEQATLEGAADNNVETQTNTTLTDTTKV